MGESRKLVRKTRIEWRAVFMGYIEVEVVYYEYEY